jgi:hypothetical protein
VSQAQLRLTNTKYRYDSGFNYGKHILWNETVIVKQIPEEAEEKRMESVL